MPVDVDPAEHDVARRLHQPLALDDALAVVGVLALARGTARAPTAAPPSPGGTAGRCSSRPSISTIQARVPTLPTPTTLRAAVRRTGSARAGAAGRPASVRRYERMIARIVSSICSASIAPAELLDRHDQRRVADDPRLAVDDVGELVERAQAVLRPRLGDVLLERSSPPSRLACLRKLLARSRSTSRRAYQRSSVRIAANSRIASRYALPDRRGRSPPAPCRRSRGRGRRRRSSRPAASRPTRTGLAASRRSR